MTIETVPQYPEGLGSRGGLSLVDGVVAAANAAIVPIERQKIIVGRVFFGALPKNSEIETYTIISLPHTNKAFSWNNAICVYQDEQGSALFNNLGANNLAIAMNTSLPTKDFILSLLGKESGRTDYEKITRLLSQANLDYPRDQNINNQGPEIALWLTNNQIAIFEAEKPVKIVTQSNPKIFASVAFFD